MWQRFTERARKVIFYAQDEATSHGEGYVSTEFLLLGIARDPGSVATRVLDALGVTLEQVRGQVEAQVVRGDGGEVQDMQLTPRVKQVIDLAYDEARLSNKEYIGTEHLLIGLIREGEGLAARVLTKLNVTLEAARNVVKELENEPSVRAEESLPKSDRNAPDVKPNFSNLLSRILATAPDEARLLGDTDMRAEHIFLAVIRDQDEMPARVLDSLGLSAEQVVDTIRTIREADAQSHR